MGENKGKVRNYVVNDVDFLTDILEKYLCQMGEAYVRIDNEFHCFDKILRFFDSREYIDILEEVKGVDFFTLVTSKDVASLSSALDLVDAVVVVNDGYEDERKSSFSGYTKRMQMANNKQVNDKLRASCGIQKKIINRKRHNF